MFFIMGITDGRKDFDFHQMMTCGACGAYGRYQVFMTDTTMCRRAVAMRSMSWTRRLENGLRAAGMSRFGHSICVRCIRGIVETAGILQNSAEIVVLRPRRIMNSARNAVCGFNSGAGCGIERGYKGENNGDMVL